jgi:hypothetical protein
MFGLIYYEDLYSNKPFLQAEQRWEDADQRGDLIAQRTALQDECTAAQASLFFIPSASCPKQETLLK